MNDAAKFRLIDGIDIVGTFYTARDTLKEYQKEIDDHPNLKIQIYGLMNPARGTVGAYWYINLENLEKEASKEQKI